MNIKNDLLLRAAHGLYTERVPVWLMRQAGRILPEYRAIRERLSGFKELVTTPALAAEVTLQPVHLLHVDAAIIFSDILVIPEAMGLPYDMYESKGPLFVRTISSKNDIDKLNATTAHENLTYVYEAIRTVKKELNGSIPLIGFAGAPWTLLAYMVEGHGSKTFSKAKKFLYTQPQEAHELLEKITTVTIQYLHQQIIAGADIVQIFDSWAGILSPEQYTEFSLKYIAQICKAISTVPVIVFAKGAFFARKQMAETDCSVIGLDWNMDAIESRNIIGHNKTLQGNLDPCVLYASYNEIRKQTQKMIDRFGTQRYIANLGHGVYADTPADNVRCFIDTVKEYSSMKSSFSKTQSFS
ncbi:MAG: uroporphyrinogen decarboxylase [Cytophagaceae bacterium]|nr:uroporphyrinogen decarboxylase [Cytophagaceae bacterium]MDW8455931.1 uroporphyrinogen decarboxylase [Cytophagaceae bacterium]